MAFGIYTITGQANLARFIDDKGGPQNAPFFDAILFFFLPDAVFFTYLAFSISE
jgi:hypothetical protein